MIEFSYYDAPEGFKYQVSKHSDRFYRVDMLHPLNRYTYKTKQITTVWGFIHIKTGIIHSPVNSKTPGKSTTLEETTQWTAMKPPKQNPLQILMLGK